MPEGLLILSYEFHGRAETNDTEIVWELNKDAENISSEIEKEISKLFFRSFPQVKADINFYHGSILVQGSVIILSWLGSVILTAGKAAIEEQVSNVVKIVIKRALNRAIMSINNSKAAPFTDPFREINVIASQLSVPQEAPPAAPSVTVTPSRTETSSVLLQGLLIANSILLVLIVILLLLPYIVG